jgi:cyclic pyranopterin monophosphate synthase
MDCIMTPAEPTPTNQPAPTHIDDRGTPRMVDVSAKAPTVRRALAEAHVVFPPDALASLRATAWQSAKGAVWHTAVIAGTQAAKRTADLIPFCHPLPIEGCAFDIEETDDGLRIRCEVRVTHKTGVEMEALTGASVAALTVIDMCKALSPAIRITEVRLREKSGGKSEVALP